MPETDKLGRRWTAVELWLRIPAIIWHEIRARSGKGNEAVWILEAIQERVEREERG